MPTELNTGTRWLKCVKKIKNKSNKFQHQGQRNKESNSVSFSWLEHKNRTHVTRQRNRDTKWWKKIMQTFQRTGSIRYIKREYLRIP